MNTLSGQSLLQHIVNGDLEAVTVFLRNEVVNLDERDQDGQTFLMIACQLGAAAIVKRLLEECSVDINAKDNDNWTALLNAAKQGSAEIVQLLLDADADIEHRDLAGWTALMWACYKGRSNSAKMLLDRDANPNVKGEHHMSCLTWAAGRGHTDIVGMLLLHNAKVNTADKYGTTPLIWAARKGHTEIVAMLLRDGAVVDKAGMNSWTALIVAASGGYADIVRLLLEHHPNVNAVDEDGFTALTLAAKEGYLEIVNMLLQSEAYVNLPDRYGDTILIHAVKNNHIEIVRSLLKKHADVDVQGVDNKTALYWAAEKNNLPVAKLLLEHNANMEIAKKDSDTPLLRAVRNRSLEMAQLLVDKGAKVSTTDVRGDNALHIAVRGRSKRLTEYLLRNPKNARLLYNKNKNDETAYEIDATHERSVLTQVFGARNLNADDNLQGYELYSSTIADVLSEPSLRTPITVGLFARWGSGKSFLIGRLRKEMEAFAYFNSDPMFQFDLMQFVIVFFLSFAVGCVFSLTIMWPVGLGVGAGLFLILYILLAILWFGINRRDWALANRAGAYLSKKQQSLKLFLQLLFCNAPVQKNRDTAAIRFMFTDNARLNTLMGEKSITGIVGTLCDALEQEYGILVPRLYRIFKPRKAIEHGRFKSLCCIPYCFIAFLIIVCLIAMILMLANYGFDLNFHEEQKTVTNSIIIALAIIVALSVIGNIYTLLRMIVNIATPTRKQVQKVAQHIDSSKMDGFIQLLKKEVESIGRMTRCMDAFTGNHSRLVVIVDGLDSCEQDKLLILLDMVHVLFGDTNSPFVTILAVDPHVIIKGIEHNLHSHFHESSINGHDYLRNIVQLPFFIQSQTLPRPPQRNMTRGELSTMGDKVATDGSFPVSTLSAVCHRQESCMSGASYLSLTDIGKGGKSGRRQKQQSSSTTAMQNFGSTNLIRQPSVLDLSKSLGKTSYFSDINPRNMKRLMNILAVTGRLLRAHNVEFNWYKLASWINLTEQWPYRLSWIILEVEDNDDIDDMQAMKHVYDRVSSKIPSSRDVDPLVEIDRNIRKLEVFLANNTPPLTVADMRRFLPCTINVDPYLRKLIRELQQNTENMHAELGLYGNNIGAGFDPTGTWSRSNYGPHGSQRRRNYSGSPRQTPTRSFNAPSSYGTQPYMYPPQMFMPPPAVMQQMYMQMSEAQQNRTNLVMKPQVCIKVKGGVGNRSLGLMTIDDIVELLQRVEGLNTSKINYYVNQLRDNNINGVVLMNCNLSELKSALQMSFGDWELFRGLVEMLREMEQVEIYSNDKSDERPMEDVESINHVKFTKAKHVKDNAVEVPKAIYSKGSEGMPGNGSLLAGKTKRVVSDVNTRSASSTVTDVGSQSSSTLNIRKPGSSSSGSSERSKTEDGVLNALNALNASKKLNRQDSFVNEVMMETAALRDYIEATVDSSGSDSETAGDMEEQAQRVTKFDSISPIPEEPSFQDISRQTSLASLSRQPVMSRQVSQESTTVGDRVFFVGPDNDSGESDSEEVERLSRKSSIVRRVAPKSPQKSNRIDHSNVNINAIEDKHSNSDLGDKTKRPTKQQAEPNKGQKKPEKGVYRNGANSTTPLLCTELKDDLAADVEFSIPSEKSSNCQDSNTADLLDLCDQSVGSLSCSDSRKFLPGSNQPSAFVPVLSCSSPSISSRRSQVLRFVNETFKQDIDDKSEDNAITESLFWSAPDSVHIEIPNDGNSDSKVVYVNADNESKGSNQV